MRRFLSFAVLAILLAGSVGYLFAQGQTTRRESVVWHFLNGIVSGTYDADGADPIVIGSADVTSITLTADGAQDADVVLPANSIGGAEVSGMRIDLIFCGQADENGTIYFSPTAGVNGVDFGDGVDYSISSAACDALDDATEATADLVVFPEVAFKVMGMYCQQAGAEALGAAETMVFTLRSAGAGLTPAVTCTISEAQRGCRSLTGSTTNIAAGATVAMQVVQTSNNTDQDGWCQVSIMLQ